MNLEERQQFILKNGERNRGEYDPVPGSFPLKVYLWWKENGIHDINNKNGMRENYCHYWRVVLIWAPLQFILLGFFGLIAKFAAPVYRYFKNNPDQFLRRGGRATRDWFSDHRDGIGTVANWAYVIFMGAVCLVFAATILFGLYLLATGGQLVATLITLAVIVALVAAVAFVIVKVKEAFERASERKLLANRAREDAWMNGEISDDEFFHRTPERPAGPVQRFFLSVLDKVLNALDAIIALIKLAFQAVRVTKWKICPMVKIPTN